MCLKKRIDWIGLHSAAWVIQQWLSVPREIEHRSCTVHEVGKLSSSNLLLNVYRIPGEPMMFSSHKKAQESGFQCQQRMAEAAAE